jgi:hypothetical protein
MRTAKSLNDELIIAGQSELSVLVLVHNDSHITVTGRKLFEKKITVAL